MTKAGISTTSFSHFVNNCKEDMKPANVVAICASINQDQIKDIAFIKPYSAARANH